MFKSIKLKWKRIILAQQDIFVFNGCCMSKEEGTLVGFQQSENSFTPPEEPWSSG